MKKITLYIIALCSSIGMMAAEYEYVPVVREGVEWGYHDRVGGLQVETPYHIQLKGDAIINDKNYKQVFRYTSCSLGDDAILMGWMREEDKKVYFLANPDISMNDFGYYLFFEIPNEILIYDFNPENVGDKVVLYDNKDGDPNHIVEKVDYIEVDGKLRKRLQYSTWRGQAVEGQGIMSYGGGTLFLPGLPEPTGVYFVSILDYIKKSDGTFEYLELEIDDDYIDPCVASVEDIGRDKLNITQSKDAIAIEMPTSNGISVIELVDISGRVAYSKYVDAQSTFTLSTASFAHGTYILIVSSESTKLSRKIVIK